MASNGGTLSLHGGPQVLQSCSLCGLNFDSATSLQVHMQYQHQQESGATRWSASSTDTENNNQPVKNHHHIKSSNSPIAAAADSSDQPGTPVAPESQYSPSQSTYVHAAPTEMHPYHPPPPPSSYLGYDQYYHHPHPNHLDYGVAVSSFQSHQEYKTVPSRYHPYNTSVANNNQVSAVPKNGASPKISSSGSPIEMFGGASAIVDNSSTSPSHTGQPTPSPSPKQCDKCGTVCETDNQLLEHCARAHPTSTDSDLEAAAAVSGGGYFAHHQYITPKEEPCSDILDLDSQKMVYPQHLMHLQSMQRHPMMWEPAVPHFQPPTYKTEYPPTPPIKSENNGAFQATQKIFNGDENPQDFPSTTTPGQPGQEPGYRNFEPPSSSLPVKSTSWKSNEARRPKTYNCTACNKWFTSSGHLKRHYNTTLHKNAVKSSGAPDPALTPISHHHHPNRDPNYSGKMRRSQAANQQPLQQPVPPPEPPILRGSPDYQPQYPLPSFGGGGVNPAAGFQSYTNQQQINGGHPNGVAGPSVHHASQPRGLLIYSSTQTAQQQQAMEALELQQEHQHQLVGQESHNKQAMDQIQLQPPVQQPPHTIIITNSPLTIMQQQQPDSSEIHNTTEQYSTTQQHNPLTINTNTMQSYQVEQQGLNYHHIIGNSSSAMAENATTLMEVYDYNPVAYRSERNMYAGDMAPPFSPDIPHEMYTVIDSEGRALTPLQGAMAPTTSPAPCSPSVTSTTSGNHDVKPQVVLPDPAAAKKSSEFRCHQCDKLFNKVCYLTQHNKTFHCGDKPFKCQRCGKRFPCEESSEEHFQKHAGDKPFKCEICPKQFNHKTDLRRHMCIHTGSKPFCCAQCGKGFIRKDHMIKHTDTHRKKEAMLANKKAAAKCRQLKKVVQLFDSGSDISNASSCKNEPMIF